MTPYYLALFGAKHISQSYSPLFHQQFAQQFNIDLDYKLIIVTAENFVDAWKEFVNAGGHGANVTNPCKHLAFKTCTSHSAVAKVTQSVNTLCVQSATQWYGDSTDGVGLIRDIVNYHGHTLKNKRILLLGAGGAAAGILPALGAEQPQEIIIANRTLANAQQLEKNQHCKAYDFSTIPQEAFDVVINTATELSLPELNINFNHDAIAYDIRYTTNAQDFIIWAQANGAHYTYDGYGMLLEQAAASFKVWFDVQPSTESLRAR